MLVRPCSVAVAGYCSSEPAGTPGVRLLARLWNGLVSVVVAKSSSSEPAGTPAARSENLGVALLCAWRLALVLVGLGASLWRDLVCRRSRGRRLLGLGSRWPRSAGIPCWFLCGIGRSWGGAATALSFCICPLVVRNSGRRIGLHHRCCRGAALRLELVSLFLRLRILRSGRHPRSERFFGLARRLRIALGLRAGRILPVHFLPGASSRLGLGLSTLEDLLLLA